MHAAVLRNVHFEAKMYKTRQLRSTFWSSDVEKMHAASWRKAIVEVKMYKTRQQRTVFWSSDVQKLVQIVS